eukprot:2209149-Prymnesium_polylepis.1
MQAKRPNGLGCKHPVHTLRLYVTQQPLITCSCSMQHPSDRFARAHKNVRVARICAVAHHHLAHSTQTRQLCLQALAATCNPPAAGCQLNTLGALFHQQSGSAQPEASKAACDRIPPTLERCAVLASVATTQARHQRAASSRHLLRLCTISNRTKQPHRASTTRDVHALRLESSVLQP